MAKFFLVFFATVSIICNASTPALVFITIGQSNADGSAFPDADEDARQLAWYAGKENPHNAKMWYRACYTHNNDRDTDDTTPVFRICDASAKDCDAAPGWMELWYRNEHTQGRTAMNILTGTWKTGNGKWVAQGRRAMEPELAMILQKHLPGVPLFFIKLGVSGSQISTWADPADDTNWNYFYEMIYTPAVESLNEMGYEPKICGVWWMQGCSDKDRSREYYETRLERLVNRLSSCLGQKDVPIFIGHISKPGENPLQPKASVHYGDGVRQAQDNVATRHDNVTIIDTSVCSFQDEKSFGGPLHIDHKGLITLARVIAPLVVNNWKLNIGSSEK